MYKKEGEMFLFRLKMIHLDFEGNIQISASQVNIIKWMLNKFDSVIDILLRRVENSIIGIL